MPIYEYECEFCGQRMETIQKMSDEPLKECPECGEPALKKLVSAGAFILKGSGWYQTDFKDNGKKKDSNEGKAKATDKPKANSPPSSGSGASTAASPSSN